MDELMDRNAAFARDFAHGGRTAAPDLRTVVVTCLDPRVDPAHFLGLGVGEAAAIRVLGGRVSDQVVRDLAVYASFAAADGAGLLVVVVHHTDCGAAVLADADAARGIAQRTGVSRAGLDAVACADPADSVRADLERIRSASGSLPPGVEVAGYVYDVRSGRLEEIAGRSALTGAP